MRFEEIKMNEAMEVNGGFVSLGPCGIGKWLLEWGERFICR